MGNGDDRIRAWHKIVAQAWINEDFKERLLSDPVTVLKEEGLDMPDGVEVTVLEQTPNKRFLIIPPVPDGISGEVEEARERLQAGGGIGYFWI
ncbi:NHLP leader peptide family RiPP precursor [Thermodesulfobacteriota bacterium]